MVGSSAAWLGLGRVLCWCSRWTLFFGGTAVRFCSSSELEVLKMSLQGGQKEKGISSVQIEHCRAPRGRFAALLVRDWIRVAVADLQSLLRLCLTKVCSVR